MLSTFHNIKMSVGTPLNIWGKTSYLNVIILDYPTWTQLNWPGFLCFLFCVCLLHFPATVHPGVLIVVSVSACNQCVALMSGAPLSPVRTQRSKLCSVCSASCHSGCTLDPDTPPRRLLAEQLPRWPEVHMTPVDIKRHNVMTTGAAGSFSTRLNRLFAGCFMFNIKFMWGKHTQSHLMSCCTVIISSSNY